jgi:hypothetical protein
VLGAIAKGAKLIQDPEIAGKAKQIEEKKEAESGIELLKYFRSQMAELKFLPSMKKAYRNTATIDLNAKKK